MHIRPLLRFVSGAVVLSAVLTCTSCANTPSRTGLVKKLEQVNGLTKTQATCVADGLFDGVPSADPAIKALSKSELRAVAKPDNAGKVHPATTQTLRDVVTRCVPVTPQTAAR